MHQITEWKCEGESNRKQKRLVVWVCQHATVRIHTQKNIKLAHFFYIHQLDVSQFVNCQRNDSHIYTLLRSGWKSHYPMDRMHKLVSNEQFTVQVISKFLEVQTWKVKQISSKYRSNRATKKCKRLLKLKLLAEPLWALLLHWGQNHVSRVVTSYVWWFQCLNFYFFSPSKS